MENFNDHTQIKAYTSNYLGNFAKNSQNLKKSTDFSTAASEISGLRKSTTELKSCRANTPLMGMADQEIEQQPIPEVNEEYKMDSDKLTKFQSNID